MPFQARKKIGNLLFRTIHVLNFNCPSRFAGSKLLRHKSIPLCRKEANELSLTYLYWESNNIFKKEWQLREPDNSCPVS
jgi:hypothetical protein